MGMKPAWLAGVHADICLQMYVHVLAFAGSALSCAIIWTIQIQLKKLFAF